MATATRTSVQVRDGARLDPEARAADAAAFNAFEREIWPDDPLTSPAEQAAAHAAIPDHVRRYAIRAHRDGVLAGSIDIEVDPFEEGVDLVDDGPRVLRCTPHVLPGHRRHGVAASMVSAAIAIAQREGRTRLVFTTYSTAIGGGALASAMGATPGMASRTNHLLLRDVDQALLQRWIDEAPERSPGYELLSWDGAIPDEHLDAYLELLAELDEPADGGAARVAMPITSGEWRAAEARAAALGQERWTLVTRRIADGALVGLHDLSLLRSFPHSAFIWSTGVREADRGKWLGRWMKAVMTLRLVRERPGVHDIRTDNADGNPAMAAINERLGYLPLLATTTWHIPVGLASRWLEVEGVPRFDLSGVDLPPLGR